MGVTDEERQSHSGARTTPANDRKHQQANKSKVLDWIVFRGKLYHTTEYSVENDPVEIMKVVMMSAEQSAHLANPVPAPVGHRNAARNESCLVLQSLASEVLPCLQSSLNEQGKKCSITLNICFMEKLCS